MAVKDLESAFDSLAKAREQYANAVRAVMDANDGMRQEAGTDYLRVQLAMADRERFEKVEKITDARVAIIEAIEEHRASHGVGVSKAVRAVVMAYPSRTVQGLDGWVYEYLSKFGEATVWGWRKAFKDHGRVGLVPQWKGRTASYETSSELPGLIQQIISDDNEITGLELHDRLMRETPRADTVIPSVKTCQRIIRRRKTM